MTASRRTWFLIGGIVVLLATFVASSFLVLAAVQGSPLRMVIEPSADGTVVGFHDPDHSHVSPPFRLDSSLAVRREIVLDSSDVRIPDGTVEFADTTLLPGRFTIRMGSTTFDVMTSRLVVNGKETEWRRE